MKIPLLVLLLSGCSPNPDLANPKPNRDTGLINIKESYFKRINIDGVDCVIGIGRYDAGSSISCDWTNKRAVHFNQIRRIE